MPIAFETGQRGGDAERGGRRRSRAQAAGSASSGRGSDSQAAVMQCGDDMDDGDGEVESSYKGALDTMDTLQDALLGNRRVTKFYNGKTGTAMDVVPTSQAAKEVARPANPSPKKRKGLFSFSFSWGKTRSRESSSSRGNASTNSSKSFKKALSPAAAATSCASSGNSKMRDNQRGFLRDPPRRSSLQTGLRSSRLISVQMMKSLSMAGLEDVTESTASVSSREKRRKSLE